MTPEIPLSPELTALVAAERPDLVPPTGASERVWAGVAARLAAPGLPSRSGRAKLPRGAGTLSKLAGHKLSIALVSFGLGAGTGAEVVRRARPPIPATALPPAPLLPEPPPAARPLSSVEAPALPRPDPAHRSPRPAASPPPAPGETLAAEQLLLERAHTALDRGDAAAALAATEEHARTFPHGELAEERDALRVQALVALGRLGDGRAAAAHFANDHPHSLLRPAVEDAVKSAP
ncbi:MAG: hypothetical protein ACYDCL_08520 [Myxococcales bacterium]